MLCSIARDRQGEDLLTLQDYTGEHVTSQNFLDALLGVTVWLLCNGHALCQSCKCSPSGALTCYGALAEACSPGYKRQSDQGRPTSLS